MKALYTILVASLLVLAAVPSVFAVNVGSGIGVDINTEDFEPRVWMCDSRIVTDDNVEPGRFSAPGEELLERINNYAFEGEMISWTVLVFDKNGIEKVKDVFATVGDSQGAGNDIEVNCKLDHIIHPQEDLNEACNARILEEVLKFAPENTAAYYVCKLTVETPKSMYGEFWVTVEAEDIGGLSGTMDENEFWFFNPVVALSIDGDVSFDTVRPGTQTYSDTILVGNDADLGSGVMLDMFISGTDFYDSASSGAKCPTTNQLALTNFRYFATSGAYSTSNDEQIGPRGTGPVRNKDIEGYVNIGYADGFNDPTPFYEGFEIIQAPTRGGPGALYWPGNILAPGAEMALTFKLALPVPCNGDFDSGSIFFWGEAI